MCKQGQECSCYEKGYDRGHGDGELRAENVIKKVLEYRLERLNTAMEDSNDILGAVREFIFFVNEFSQGRAG